MEDIMTAQEAIAASDNCVSLWSTEEMEEKALQNFKTELEKAVMVGERVITMHGRCPDIEGLPCFSRFTKAPVMTKKLKSLLESKGYRVTVWPSLLSMVGAAKYDFDCKVMWGEE